MPNLSTFQTGMKKYLKLLYNLVLQYIYLGSSCRIRSKAVLSYENEQPQLYQQNHAKGPRTQQFKLREWEEAIRALF